MVSRLFKERNSFGFQEGSNDEHAVGMALFDAALSLYSPEQPWKQIATGERLDPKIMSRLDELGRLPLLKEASP